MKKLCEPNLLNNLHLKDKAFLTGGFLNKVVQTLFSFSPWGLGES